MENYETVTEAIKGLKSQGYMEDFNLDENCIVCGEDTRLQSHEFEVVKYFRFEGETNPSDEAAVYAIASHNKQIKGILVTGFGASQEPMLAEILSKINIAH